VSPDYHKRVLKAEGEESGSGGKVHKRESPPRRKKKTRIYRKKRIAIKKSRNVQGKRKTSLPNKCCEIARKRKG